MLANDNMVHEATHLCSNSIFIKRTERRDNFFVRVQLRSAMTELVPQVLTRVYSRGKGICGNNARTEFLSRTSYVETMELFMSSRENR